MFDKKVNLDSNWKGVYLEITRRHLPFFPSRAALLEGPRMKTSVWAISIQVDGHLHRLNIQPFSHVRSTWNFRACRPFTWEPAHYPPEPLHLISHLPLCLTLYLPPLPPLHSSLPLWHPAYIPPLLHTHTETNDTPPVIYYRVRAVLSLHFDAAIPLCSVPNCSLDAGQSSSSWQYRKRNFRPIRLAVVYPFG